MTRKWHFV